MSEHEFARLIASNADAMLVVDAEGCVRLANPAAERLFGRSGAGLVGEPFGFPVAGSGHAEIEIRRSGGEMLVAEMAVAEVLWDGDPASLVSVRDVTERKRSAEQLAHAALHDPLTGLPNRALLLDRLGRGLARLPRVPTSLAVLYCDVDGFKEVNDRLGHDRGDELLVAVAQDLVRCVRPGDTVARLGGDEFVLVCEGLTARHEAVGVARRLVDAVAGHRSVGSDPVEVSLSVGVVVTRQGGQRPEDLLREADQAMYAAKRTGPGRFRFATAGLVAAPRSLTHPEVERGLRAALAGDELELRCAPELDLATGATVALSAEPSAVADDGRRIDGEALVAAARRARLLEELTARTVRLACREAARWTPDGLPVPPAVAVAIPSAELLGPPLVAVIDEALVSSGLDPGRLRLDVAEGALAQAGYGATALLRRLQGRGVRVAVDRLGAGPLHLGLLRRLPLAAARLDPSLAPGRDEADPVLLDAVRAALRALAVPVVATGVDHADQIAALGLHGIVQASGVALAPPLTPEEARAWLAVTRRPSPTPGAKRQRTPR